MRRNINTLVPGTFFRSASRCCGRPGAGVSGFETVTEETIIDEIIEHIDGASIEGRTLRGGRSGECHVSGQRGRDSEIVQRLPPSEVRRPSHSSSTTLKTRFVSSYDQL